MQPYETNEFLYFKTQDHYTDRSDHKNITQPHETNGILYYRTRNHYTAPRNQRTLIFYDTESLRSPTKPTNSHILRHRINTQPNEPNESLYHYTLLYITIYHFILLYIIYYYISLYIIMYYFILRYTTTLRYIIYYHVLVCYCTLVYCYIL